MYTGKKLGEGKHVRETVLEMPESFYGRSWRTASGNGKNTSLAGVNANRWRRSFGHCVRVTSIARCCRKISGAALDNP